MVNDFEKGLVMDWLLNIHTGDQLVDKVAKKLAEAYQTYSL
jgi:hypothetical protein